MWRTLLVIGFLLLGYWLTSTPDSMRVPRHPPEQSRVPNDSPSEPSVHGPAKPLRPQAPSILSNQRESRVEAPEKLSAIAEYELSQTPESRRFLFSVRSMVAEKVRTCLPPVRDESVLQLGIAVLAGGDRWEIPNLRVTSILSGAPLDSNVLACIESLKFEPRVGRSLPRISDELEMHFTILARSRATDTNDASVDKSIK
jgi:hypothetical protein